MTELQEPKSLIPNYTNMPNTQKARSVVYGIPSLYYNKIGVSSLRGDHDILVPPKVKLIKTEEHIQTLNYSNYFLEGVVFARPCPLTPRHGFVDSRVVKNTDELLSLFKEMKRVDPDGEIILSKFIDNASANAILTNSGMLSIGPGHDGATAGKSSISFSVKPEKLDNDIINHSGLSKNSGVFIEAVFKAPQVDNQSYFVTQIRGGPMVEPISDFIPKKMKVKKIVIPHNDLLKWEEDARNFEAGTVVYGKGHTLASHAAIHCVLNKVPFVTSFEPKVGDILQKVALDSVKLDKKMFCKGVTLGLTNPIKIGPMLHFSAMVLHNWAYLRTSEHGSWMLGLASSYLVQVLCALSYGEFRHGDTSKLRYMSRDNIYHKVLSAKSFQYYIKQSPEIAAQFLNRSKFRSGYGGKRWAKAALMSVNIWNILCKIQETDISVVRSNALIKQLNVAVNLVHNNGWLFNKISSQTVMTKVSKHPGLAALEMADFIYQNYLQVLKIKRIRKISTVSLNRTKKVAGKLK